MNVWILPVAVRDLVSELHQGRRLVPCQPLLAVGDDLCRGHLGTFPPESRMLLACAPSGGVTDTKSKTL